MHSDLLLKHRLLGGQQGTLSSQETQLHALSTKSTEITRKTSGTENEEKKALVHFEHSAQVDRGAAELFTLVFRPGPWLWSLSLRPLLLVLSLFLLVQCYWYLFSHNLHSFNRTFKIVLTWINFFASPGLVEKCTLAAAQAMPLPAFQSFRITSSRRAHLYSVIISFVLAWSFGWKTPQKRSNSNQTFA